MILTFKINQSSKQPMSIHCLYTDANYNRYSKETYHLYQNSPDLPWHLSSQLPAQMPSPEGCKIRSDTSFLIQSIQTKSLLFCQTSTFTFDLDYNKQL